MYQYVRTWVFGFKVSVCVFIMYQYVPTWVFCFQVSVSVYLLCTSMYLPGFLVLRFSGYVPVCPYLGFSF